MPQSIVLAYTLLATLSITAFICLLLVRSIIKYRVLYQLLRKKNLEVYDKTIIIHRYNEIMRLYSMRESYIQDIIKFSEAPKFVYEKHMEDIAMQNNISDKIIEIYEEIAAMQVADKDK